MLAIVGESGSGKSVGILAVTGLLPPTATVTADRMTFGGIDLQTIAPKQRRAVIGRDIAMIFQEPIASLNPCFTVGFQIEEVLTYHKGLRGRARRERAVELLEAVGLNEAYKRLAAFPHQLSGGQCQRVMIAMVIACNPKLLIAVAGEGLTREMRRKVQIVFQNPYGSLNPRQKIGDALMDPLLLNTGLAAGERRERAMQMLGKVGLRPEHFNRYPHMFSGGQRQRVAIARALMLSPGLQVLNLLADLQDEFGLTYVFISHDLSVVRYIADEVMVMYYGEVVEAGTRDAVFGNPRHEYTKKLFAATPRADVDSIRERVERRRAARLAQPA